MVQLRQRFTPALLYGIISLILCYPLQSIASAWTLPKGDVQIINTMLYYENEYFSPKDDRTYRLEKWQYNPYAEIGVTDKLTLAINAHIDTARQYYKPVHIDSSRDRSTAITDIELSLRQRLYKKNNFVLSFQPMVKLPGTLEDSCSRYIQRRISEKEGAITDYLTEHPGANIWDAVQEFLPTIPKNGKLRCPGGDDSNTPLGSGGLDTEMRVLGGYGFRAFDRQHFANLEMAYRYRNGQPSDELRLDGTVGIQITDRLQWLEQVFTTYALGKLPVGYELFANTMDYRLVKVQSSALYALNDNLSVQLGITQDAYAKNFERGQGVIAALWVKF